MSTFGRYEITRELGRGGMASVFEANDPRFGRSVAVKVLPREMLFDPAFRARFDREARTIAMLEHSGIVPVHDYGEQDGQPFIVMRFMPGGSLADRLKNGALPMRQTAQIFDRIAPAIDYAHAQGVVHRDLKPANILFDNAGEAYIADFGIAKLSENAATLGLTQGVIGTPAYMSPEQWEGKSVGSRSDLYSLGIILYEMLAGRLPYVADSVTGFMRAHLFDPIPTILNAPPSFAAPLQKVIQRILAKSPDQRYPTAASLAEDLQAIADGRMIAPETQVLQSAVPVAPPPVNVPVSPPPSYSQTPVPANPSQGVPPAMTPSQPGYVAPVPAYAAPPYAAPAGGMPVMPPVAAAAPKKSRTGLVIGIVGGAAALAAVVCGCAFVLPAVRTAMDAASTTPTTVRPTSVSARGTDTPAVRATPSTATPRPAASVTPVRTSTPSGTRAATATPVVRATAGPSGLINLATRDGAAILRAVEAAKLGGTTLLDDPLSGDLAHQPGAKKVTWLRPDLYTADFIAEVVFGNPFASTEGTWDYGFFFRIDDEAKSHYRFVIKSTGAWELRLVENDNVNAPVAASGTLNNLATARGASNKVTLVAYGDRGTFFVNGVWSGSVWDLSSLTDGGDVAIMTGMFNEDHKAGASTKYAGYQVWDVER